MNIFTILSTIERGEKVDHSVASNYLEAEKRHYKSIRNKSLKWELLDSLWIQSILYGHIGDRENSCNCLEKQLDLIESIRASTKDISLRPGFVGRFKYIHSNLCEMQFNLGLFDNALSTIEKSKGRFLADILLKDSDQIEYSRHNLVSLLTEKAPSGTNYLTALVGEKNIFLILVTNNGEFFPKKIPIIKFVEKESTIFSDKIEPANYSVHEELASIIEKAINNHWGKSKDCSKNNINYLENFSELVNWMEEIIPHGHHIVFSPDAELPNIPIHLLPFKNGQIRDNLTVSRVHGMQDLAYILNREPSTPNKAVGFVVPSQSDGNTRGKTKKIAKLKSLRKTEKILENVIPNTIVYQDGDADISAYSRMKLSNTLVHFSTHGQRPRFNMTEASSGNKKRVSPLAVSGLLLANEGNLPNYDSFFDLKYPGRLSPQKIIDLNIDLDKSHVSLMACVSGLAKEGRGGDSLGLEWAFFRCGTASVLGSYWDISADLSIQLFSKFYKYWFNGNSRANALYKAMDDLIVNDENAGAYVLSGDWR